MSKLTVEQMINLHEMKAKAAHNFSEDTKTITRTAINYTVEEHEQIESVLKEFVKYKNMESQGKLVLLPCAPGDIVYSIDHKSNLGENRQETQRLSDKLSMKNLCVNTVPFSPACLDDDFKLKSRYFATKEEAEGHILLLQKMDIVHTLHYWLKDMESMSYDGRYETMMKICHDVGADIISAEFVEELNDYIASKVPAWKFIYLPADVQFEWQAYLQKQAQSEEIEEVLEDERE